MGALAGWSASMYGWLGMLPIVVLAAACETTPRSSASLPDAFWSPNTGSPAQRFEHAKRSEPELIAFLRRFPKGADLHNHLGGATYDDYLLDSARAANKRYDVVHRKLTDATGEGTVSLDELERSGELLGEFRDAISMRGAVGGVNGHDHFFQTFERISAAGRSSDAMLAEVLQRNRYQNVAYLEVMASPISTAAIDRFRAAFRGLDVNDLETSFAPFEGLVDDPDQQRLFRQEVDAREAAVGALLGMPLVRYPVKVRYVLSLDRVGALERFFVATVLFISALRADERFVAINIVAPEDAPSSRRQFDAQMKILDFLWRRLGPVNMTLHSGELTLRDSPVEPMSDRIRRTIDEGHARRIGHGTSVAWERDVVGLLAKMRDGGILVEVTLSSAEGILDVQGDEHPFRLYLGARVPICLTTDDEGVNRSNLTMEYVKAATRYRLDYDTLKRLSRNCVEYSFAGGDSLFLESDYAALQPDFAAVRSPGWAPTAAQRAAMEANPRLALQVGLERAFVEFESALQSGFREKTAQRQFSGAWRVAALTGAGGSFWGAVDAPITASDPVLAANKRGHGNGGQGYTR